jgi:glycosyltransferase involved in cell wall biosynthesis
MMKYNIYINGRFLSQKVTGVQRYAWGVVRAWDEALAAGEIDPAVYTLIVLAPADCGTVAEFKHIQVVRSAWCRGKLWEQVVLPFASSGEMLFSPYAAAPAFKRKHVVTIHDAGASATPYQYTAAFRAWYHIVYRAIALCARKILTVSEFSKIELNKHYEIPLSKIDVAYPGHYGIQSSPAEEGILARNGLTKNRFVLGVSSMSPVKNFVGLAAAHKHLGRQDYHLVIVGGGNTRIFQDLGRGLASSAVFLGYVSDAELRALYENAACFAYPSYYEGFGLPPIEAMSCGCPVVVSNRAALAEVCGDAALYCDPDDPIDISRKIATVLDDAKLARDLCERGRAHAQRYTYKQCAAKIWSEISRLLDE